MRQAGILDLFQKTGIYCIVSPLVIRSEIIAQNVTSFTGSSKTGRSQNSVSSPGPSLNVILNGLPFHQKKSKVAIVFLYSL